MAELLHDLLDTAAGEHPDAIAVHHRDDAQTYRQLQATSRRLASWLTGAGVRRGDRVIIALPVDVMLPALLYACSRIGGVFVVLRPELPETTAAHILEDAEPVLLISDAAGLRALAHRAGIAHRGLGDLRLAARSHPALPTPRGPLAVDPACFIYTSGSTGTPKAVVSPHAQIIFALRAIQSELAYRPDDIVFCALPLAFDYGLYQIFLCTLAAAELRLATAAGSGQRLLAELCQAGATVLPAVPPLALALARLLSRPAAGRPPLRLLTNTGAAMPQHLLKELRSLLPGLQVQLMFGLTECKRAAIMPKDEDLRRPGACGRALPGTEIYAVDEDGTRLPPDRIGELVVRGPHVMAGYWRRPELTAQRFPRAEGLFPLLRTGDYGRLDSEGYLYFAGRRDDLYKERGFRVSTIEVEAAAHRIDGVREAAVLPPAAHEEGALLLVVGDLTPQEVLDRLRHELEDIKMPARCVAVPALPVNANGKIDRGELVRLAGAGRD
ncbi:class I adenylate-forming enzyme family protein [Streptomyces sp. NPDC059568]|uniref:class I adenylate-forming enzyme family protein n=1 Tax=Streptomyces sp. NPDC059568 TaxID=3346868 RepID=UPI0036B3AF87